jgi:ADP-ribose pyrophosphatase YjhB (NUDIX family)
MSQDSLAALRAYAFELAGMSKTALEFVSNDYDRDRFERTLRIAESIAAMTFPDGIPQDAEYLQELGVVTPKAGCSVAAFDDEGRLLLIRRADNGRWALPGGYAEIGSTPAENALREMREETGFSGEIERFCGVFDTRSFGSRAPYQHYVLLFRARVVAGAAATSAETLAVEFFAPGELPEDMSATQRAMIDHALSGSERAAYQ